MYGRNWVMACMMYAMDHKGQFPADFEGAKGFLDKKTQSEFDAITNQFEIVYRGKRSDVKNPSKTIVMREKEAHQMPDGRWAKVYGFADGHGEIHHEADDNFDAWEKERIIAPAAPNQ
jgi:hypothetical protein